MEEFGKENQERNATEVNEDIGHGKRKKEVRLSDHFTYGKLIRFVYPSVIMMIFTSIYGVVDGLFVSNYVGKTPFSAINLVMPFLMLLGGIGFMFGTGGTALVAKTLGEGKKDTARRYFTMIVFFTLLVGICISVVGIIFMEPIAVLLGADETLLPYCVKYGRIICGFNVAFMMQNVFQSFFVSAEKPKLGLAVTIAAGISNMVLDALFIVGLDLGVVGAALATGLSQCVGGILPLFYFCFPNSSLLRFTVTKPELRPLVRAMTNGASEMVNNVTMSVVGMLYNVQLLKYAGNDGVAAYGVMMYVGFIFVAVFIGYSIGAAPLVGFHYGAGNRVELKNLLGKSIRLMFGTGVVLFLIAELLARPFAGLFVGYDAALWNMTVGCFRVAMTTYLVTGFNIYASSFFTALNNGVISAVISFLRTFGFKLTAVMLLPLAFGLNGIWWAEVTAEIAAFLISGAFLLLKRKRYGY